MKYVARVGEHTYLVDVLSDNSLSINGHTYNVNMQTVDGDQVFSFLLNDHSYEVFVNRTDNGYDVLVAGERHEVSVEDEYTQRLHKLTGKARGPKGEAQIKAPMPGMVVAVRASEGDAVKSGQGLVILEAMKMENELRAPWNGTVKQVKVLAGQKVEQGQLLMVIAAE